MSYSYVFHYFSFTDVRKRDGHILDRCRNYFMGSLSLVYIGKRNTRPLTHLQQESSTVCPCFHNYITIGPYSYHLGSLSLSLSLFLPYLAQPDHVSRILCSGTLTQPCVLELMALQLHLIIFFIFGLSTRMKNKERIGVDFVSALKACREIFISIRYVCISYCLF